MAAYLRQCQIAQSVAWPRSRRTAVQLAAIAAIALAGLLLLAAPESSALRPGPESADAAQAIAYQVTLSVGTGTQYDIYQGSSLTLPIAVRVTGAVRLAAATVLVQYDPRELRPVSCVRQAGAPGGYCNTGWDPAGGLVRFNILSADGVALDTDVGLFNLTFEPAPTATKNRVSGVTPRLESIADAQGNYMTSWLQGSTVAFRLSSVTGTAVYVGGSSSPNPISITRGTTVTVPVEVTGLPAAPQPGLGSATFSLSFDPAIVRPLACRPVQLAGASGTCALHADHVSASLLSETGLSGALTAFEVVFTTAPSVAAGAESTLALTLGAFANTAFQPITVRIFNNALKVSKTASAVVPVLRITPASQYLLDNQRVTVQVVLDNGAALATGSWGIRYNPIIVEAEACQLSVTGFCNATGQAGLVRMAVLRDPADPPFPANIGTITFRRHPQAKAQQTSSLVFEVTNFADTASAQIEYQTQSASITMSDSLGSTPAVAMTLVGAPPYLLPQGSSLDFPIRFQIDPARPITNLSGSIHYDPAVLRPTRCLRYDSGSGPSGYCNTEYDQQHGIIRFALLDEAGFAGDLTPFVFRVEAASTSKSGDKSPLHFTVEAIAGPDGVARTWSAVDESVSIKVPIPAPRVAVGPPEVQTTAIYTVPLGFTQTVPVWVDDVPDLGAGTVEIRYNWDVGRATRCTLRSDRTPLLDGGFCSLLPGVVRAAFVSSEGIDGDAHVFDIEFAQAPNVVSGASTPLAVVVDNFVDTHEVPIPTSIRSGQLDIGCYAAPVEDLHIARDGANLLLTWSHVGTTAVQYQVWRADLNAYFAFGDLGATRLATVPAPTGGTVPAYTDQGAYDPATSAYAGAWADDLNHYYMVRSMCSATQGSLRSNRVGKFTRPIVPGMNLVSLPLLPYSYRIQDVVGTQLTGANNELDSDRVWVWNTGHQDYDYAWLIAGVTPEYDGKWWSSAAWQESTMLLLPNTGFWVQNRHDVQQTIKMVGNVAEPNTQGLAIVEGMQLIGSAYPDPVVLSLDAGTFGQDGAHGANNELDADRIWYWNESRQDYDYAWLIAGVAPEYDGKWWDSAAWAESQIKLRPGVGYWYQRRGDLGFPWTNPGPVQ